MNKNQPSIFYALFIVLMSAVAFFNPTPTLSFILFGAGMFLGACALALVIVLAAFFIGGLITMFK